MKYKTIIIDPPWPIKKIQRKVRPNQKEMDYPIMSIEDIKNLPIQNLADNNSVLFLWSIQKFLPLSFDILLEWGFNYHLTLTWNKKNGMCLAGFHRKTEFILFGYKGKLELYPKRKTIPTLIEEYCDTHSKKPDILYKLIKEYYPSPRIDLFARKKHKGFDVWGNEIKSDINLENYYEKN